MGRDNWARWEGCDTMTSTTNQSFLTLLADLKAKLKAGTDGERRIGRKVGRTIYSNERLIDMFDRIEDADCAVSLHNSAAALIESAERGMEAEKMLDECGQWLSALVKSGRLSEDKCERIVELLERMRVLLGPQPPSDHK